MSCLDRKLVGSGIPLVRIRSAYADDFDLEKQLITRRTRRSNILDANVVIAVVHRRLLVVQDGRRSRVPAVGVYALAADESESIMPRISYPDLDAIDDPEIIAILERARRNGTPRPESQAIRSHVPSVVKTFSAAWEETFVEGVVDHALKELCRVYVTKTVECGYCSAQRSVDAGTPEEHYDELLVYANSDRYSDREKAALAYTDSIVWSADLATDEMWENLNRHFTDPELVELGFFIALTSGQQRWIKTLDIGHREILAETEVGLVAGSSAAD